MEDRLPKLCVACVGDFRQALHQDAGFACYELRYDLFTQAGEQPFVTNQRSAVEQRDGEFDILLVKAGAVVQRTCGGACPGSAVPKLLAYPANRVFGARAERFGLTEEQEVNIGLRVQRRASVAAERDECITGVGMERRLLRPELMQQFIDKQAAHLDACPP